MRGHPGLNFKNFFQAERALRAAGWRVVNPAAVDVANEICTRDGQSGPNYLDLGLPSTWRQFARRDLGLLLRLRAERSDAIVLLPGWKESDGARAEEAVARWIGLRRLTLKEAL